MKTGLRLIAAIVAAACLSALALKAVADSKYATGYTSAAVTFGARDSGWTVRSIYATTDKENGAAKIYERSGDRFTPTANATITATVIRVTNTGYLLTTNDLVIYQHANGTVDYRTVSAATTTNVTLSSGITVAGASGDALYEIALSGQIVVGYDGAAVGAADGIATSGDVFETVGDSPLRVVLDANTNAVLQVTAD